MNGHGIDVPPNAQSHPRMDLPSSYQGMTFSFRKRWGQLDWRKLASVDVDRIAKEMDFQALQQNIMNITFCNIEAEDFRNVDSNYIKVFKLSQLIIEYLLHSQQYLSNHSTSLQQKLVQLHQELGKAENNLKSREEELKALKKENRKRRKVIEAYQDMINAGATGLHPCPVCKREFVSSEYLLSHIHRRHPNHLSKSEPDGDVETKPKLASQEELEAKLMKQMSERIVESEKHLREEMKLKEQEAINLHLKNFEDWKEAEKKKMMLEMDEFRRPMIAELEGLQEEKAALEKTLQEKEVELVQAQSKRQSHLGHLDGAKELILDEASQSKAEISHLKESLDLQIEQMQAALKKQDQSWKQRMKRLSASYQTQLKESAAKLEALEHSVLEGSQNEAKDKMVSRRLNSLHQKMKQQEGLLQAQQEQLATLQSREPSPILPDTKEPLTSSESEDSDEDNDEVDHPDKKFTPFPRRPSVKSMYAHKQEDIDKIRRQTEVIFHDMLVNKGITRDRSSLKNSDFEEKMRTLHHEQQEKMQRHYHFAEYRQSLSQEIEEASADYKPPQTLKTPFHQQKSSPKSPKGLGKPPKPTPTPLQTVAQNEAKPQGHVEVVHFSNEPIECSESDKGDTLSTVSALSSQEISTSTESSMKVHTTQQPNSDNVNVTVVVTDTTENPPPQENLPRIVQPIQDSSWDSDSLEDLIAPNTGRISSTPIKALPTTKPAESKPKAVDNISLDSFDLSSSDPVPSKDKHQVGPKHQSGAVTSQSGLTSVSVDDFDSDLDISDLT